MSIIIDTSVLSNFASIGQLNLLRSLYGSLYLSTEVYNEIQAGREEGYHFYEGVEQFISPFTSAGWLQLIGMVSKEELQLFGELPSSLHSGDRSCLAIAQERGFIILTDDRAMRKEAKRRHIPVSGTIGCLILAIKRGCCTLEQGNFWLNEMIRQGYRSPTTDLTRWFKKN